MRFPGVAMEDGAVIVVVMVSLIQIVDNKILRLVGACASV